jgi:hypothetical protein
MNKQAVLFLILCASLQGFATSSLISEKPWCLLDDLAINTRPAGNMKSLNHGDDNRATFETVRDILNALRGQDTSRRRQATEYIWHQLFHGKTFNKDETKEIVTALLPLINDEDDKTRYHVANDVQLIACHLGIDPGQRKSVLKAVQTLLKDKSPNVPAHGFVEIG